MKLPRDLSGNDLVKALGRLGYTVTHQTGSHIHLTTQIGGEHHVTVPAHSPVKVGTLQSIFRAAGEHANLNREQLLQKLFGS